MMHGHGIWFWIVWACVLWYSTVTVYVAIRGFADIKQMLRNLRENHEAQNGEKKS